MKTDELIDRLGRDASAVTPLRAPGRRTAAWMVWAISYLVVVAMMMLAALSPAVVTATPLFFVQQSAALMMGTMAARAAFASVIPGAGDRRPWVMPAIGAAVWAGSLLWAGVHDRQPSGWLRAASQGDWPCVASMTLGGLVVGAPLAWMLRRGAPLTPGLTAFLAGLAALSVTNIETCLTRPHAFALTVLLWHGGTIAAVAALCALIGRRWLRWPAMTTGQVHSARFEP